jgi:hypothetical protein
MLKLAKTRPILALGASMLAVASATMVATPAEAQVTATLRGNVEGAGAGTSVTAIDRNTGQRTTVTTDASGQYVIVGLRPSTYRIEVQGQQPQEVVVPVGQTVVLDFGGTEDVAEASDVTVVGTRSRVETRTAVVSTNVSTAQIENLPQNDRNFLNFAALAPGVSVSPSSGARRVQAGATSADNINVFIDGLSLKNSVNHGGVAGQNFSRGNPFPQLAIQEFRVDTQNFKAEYEQAGSAIITAVTKTGGEDFHGNAFAEWQPKSFIGRPFFDRPGEANNVNGDIPKPDYNRWQYGVDLGGPIIKDVLHFYGAVEVTDQTLPSTNVNLNTADNVPAFLATQFNGSYPQTFNQKLYFGKLTLFATNEDTFNVSAFIRDESNLADYGGTAVPSHGHFLENKVNLYQFEWNHRGTSWLNELIVAYNDIRNGTPRVSDGPEIILSNDQTLGTVAALGANGFEQNDRQKTWTIRNNFTFFGGNHIVKFGTKVAIGELQREEDLQSNGAYYFTVRPVNGVQQYGAFTGFDTSTPYAARISTVPVQPATADNTQIGMFIQDDWTPNEHWTVNLGLRWDFESNAKNEDFVTPANIAAALRAYPGWQAAGINPDDYISTGNNRDRFYGAFQPRIGISYDVNGDRDLIFFAGAGRYYDRPLFITAGIETIKSYYQSVSTLYFRNPTTGACPAGAPVVNGTQQCATFSPSFRDVNNLRTASIAQGVGGDVWLLNNDTKLPYSDQFNIGIRKRFGDIQTSIAFSHIRSNNIFQFVRGNRFSNGWYSRLLQRNAAGDVIGCTDGGNTWIQDDFPNVDYAACPAKLGDLAGFNGKLNIGRNDGKSVYNAIYITAEKPFTESAQWGFTAALTLQRPRTNVAQELGSDEFYNGPAQDVYGWQNVAGTEKYRFVGTGIVRGPLGTVLSGTLTLGSGPSFGNVIFGLPNQPQEVCCYGNFGGVFYPKETFAYSNLDLRIAKKFILPWGDGQELEVNFAAFNVFDTVNRNYSAWGAGSGTDPTFEENGTVGNARSFQVGARYKF